MLENKMVKFKGDYINGSWQLSTSSDESWIIASPANLQEKIIEVSGAYSHVDLACEVARNAYRKWSRTTLLERKEYLLKLKAIFTKRSEEMTELIAREIGKPLWEAKTEASALAAKIDITLEYSLRMIADENIPNALPNANGIIRYASRGVMSVIGPFNFPAHLPNGHIIPALIAGNTVVFKPSDKAPAVAQLYAECFAEAGFPAGVFNLIQGQGEVGRRLVLHEEVDGVLFTGSYEVGRKIKQDTLDHYWKILALEMGGKNSTIVWEDADLEKAIYETVVGAYMSAGQRCSCTSKVILHKKIRDKFIQVFHETAKGLTIGHWSKNPFMGPLINAESVERYQRFQEIAKREGAESLMRGKPLELEHQGYYVSPSIHLVDKLNPNSVYQRNEIFGPNVAIYTVNEIEEAIEIVNDGGYGLVMSIFTKNRDLYEKCLVEARTGLINWNRTTNGSSSKLPFGGIRKSGNDRASGHFALQYCTVPIASIEDLSPYDKSKILPGINYQYKE